MTNIEVASLESIIYNNDNFILVGSLNNITKISNLIKYFSKKVLATYNHIEEIKNINQDCTIVLASNDIEYVKKYKMNCKIPYYIITDAIFNSDYFEKNIENILLETSLYIDKNSLDIEKLLRYESFIRPIHYLLPKNSNSKNRDLFLQIQYKLSLYYSNSNIKDKAKKKIAYKKIAFVYERLSSIKSFLGLTYNLIKDLRINYPDIQIYIYAINSMELGPYNPDIVDKFKELNINYIDTNLLFDNSDDIFYKRERKAKSIRSDIINKEIDVLISHDYNAYNNYLFSTRSAPMQVYWNDLHLDYNIKNIDKRVRQNILHGAKSEGGKYIFENFTIKKYYQDLNFSNNLQKANKIREKYPKNSILLGTAGRLIKVDNKEYLSMIAYILKKYSNVYFLCCGDGDDIQKSIIEKKVKDLDIADRFIFVGYVELSVYSKVFDIFLNTFEHLQGESASEVLASGCTPVITKFSEKFHSIIDDDKKNLELKESIGYDFKKLDSTILNDSVKMNNLLLSRHLNNRSYQVSLEYLIENPNLLLKIKEILRLKHYVNNKQDDKICFIDTLKKR
jgi:hypothetical protein